MLQSVRHALPGQRLGSAVVTQRFKPRAFHKDYDASREEQTFQLPDGRTIGFAEYGDLRGTPTIFLHGCPGSRYDGQMYIDVAQNHKIRIICPDRPGHGLSSFQHQRKLGDYPKDISQLAKHLGITKYHIFGVSGGGPYAIACAYASPQDELLTSSVIAGMGHPDVLTFKEEDWHSVMITWLAKRAPSVLRLLMNYATANEERLNKALKEMDKKFFTEEDREFMCKPETEAAIAASFKAAYAQGADGPLEDCRIYAGPWDFELKDVHRKVKLFWGLKDNRAKPGHGRHLKKHLPNAELVEFEGMSHFNTELYDDQMFRSMFQRERTDSSSTLIESEKDTITTGNRSSV